MLKLATNLREVLGTTWAVAESGVAGEQLCLTEERDYAERVLRSFTPRQVPARDQGPGLLPDCSRRWCGRQRDKDSRRLRARTRPGGSHGGFC